MVQLIQYLLSISSCNYLLLSSKNMSCAINQNIEYIYCLQHMPFHDNYSNDEFTVDFTYSYNPKKSH